MILRLKIVDYNFSPKYKLDSLNIDNILLAFTQRIEFYYFEPIDRLNDKEYGFAATTLLASLIDILAKTENHNKKDYNKPEYLDWLTNNLGFNSEITIKFYESFRCGLIHAGCIESNGQISYNQKELIEIYNNHLIVNPRILLKKIKNSFTHYINNEDPEELLRYLKNKIPEIS